MYHLKNKILALLLALLLAGCSIVSENRSHFQENTATQTVAQFTLTSNDISDGERMSKAQEFVGFGCTGENLSPHLTWSNPPSGTAAFALLAYDPDAPTGSGWWHWQIVNIPSDIRELVTGAGDINASLAPDGSQQIENDYGFKGFGGACPPPGHGIHRYQFTLHALSSVLELPDNASGAMTGYMVQANSIASVSLEALYIRE